VGQPQFLLITGNLALNPQEWLSVTQTQDIGLRQRVPSTGQSLPYAVYRPSNGCSTAGFTANAKLIPVTSTIVPAFKPQDGSFETDLFSVTGTNGKWSGRKLNNGAVASVKPSQTAGEALLGVHMACTTLATSSINLLRIRRVGTPEDIVLPKWVQKSSANVMDFNEGFQNHQALWGDKTLNLSPLVRGLANSAVNGTVIAAAYFYFVHS
jgi:hypothetical protein